MQSADWIALFERLPADLHDKLIIMTNSGMEVNVQAVLRIEPEYLVLRGRPAGSTEAGRPFFVPFDRITYVYLYRPLKDAEVQQLFGAPPAAAGPASVGVAPEPAPPPEPVVEARPEPAPPPPSPPPPLPSPPPPPLRLPTGSRSAIVERLRQRGLGQAPEPEGDK
jgi:hypothetical protein